MLYFLEVENIESFDREGKWMVVRTIAHCSHLVTAVIFVFVTSEPGLTDL